MYVVHRECPGLFPRGARNEPHDIELPNRVTEPSSPRAPPQSEFEFEGYQRRHRNASALKPRGGGGVASARRVSGFGRAGRLCASA